MKDNTDAVVTVGAGRGFVVETKKGRLVITAAHCLPHLPSGFSIGYFEERTYGRLVGPLGKPASIWAECLFVDPIADLAVLGQPDNQELYDEAIEWDEFVEGAGALAVGPCPAESRAWLLSLAGAWYETAVDNIYGGPTLVFTSLVRPLEFGMSGSPIIVNGQAAGVVVSDNSSNPYLVQALPVWVIERLKPPEGR